MDFKQQNGLKLTEEEKRRNSSCIRFFLWFIPAYLILLVSLLLLLGPRIRDNLEKGSYLEKYKAYMTSFLEKDKVELPVILYSIDGETTSYRTVEKKVDDDDHLIMEALLLPLSEEELKNGFISYIPAGTRLIGITRKKHIALLDLSKDILDSKDLNKAVIQIEKTLRSLDENLRVSILVEGDPITL